MDTFVASPTQIQIPASRPRLSRRWPRHGSPLRWGENRHNRRSAAPPGAPAAPKGKGSAPPPPSRTTIPPGDTAWLASLRPWATAFVGSLGVNDTDREDVVQEAFTRAAIEWATFTAPDELPAHTARRRWLADLLVQAARRLRGKADRLRARAPYGLERAANVIGAESHEGPIAAREQLRRLRVATTPERWRMWVSHEVDNTSVAEIARQEGRPVATVYNHLRLARRDLATALGREAATATGPLVPRAPQGGRKPRA